MSKKIHVWFAAWLLVGAFASYALAHNLSVAPPGGEEKVVWVGALGLPGQGQGLIPGGPAGDWSITPAHGKGLNVACEALEANGNGVVDIRGPGPSCPHGS